MKEDYSQEIFSKYYNSKDQVLEITLKDNTVLEGILTSFFHGDEDEGEPYICKWHFIDKHDISKHNNFFSLDDRDEYVKTINQEDIKSVKFKV
jgi:hypothetical protein